MAPARRVRNWAKMVFLRHWSNYDQGISACFFNGLQPTYVVM
jgi:hypothetical protein